MKKEITFEEGIARLEEIVGLLEQGEAPLDQSMKLFEEGIKLSSVCETKLKKAEQAIQELTGTGKTEKTAADE